LTVQIFEEGGLPVCGDKNKLTDADLLC